MDKYEYNVKLEQIKKLIRKKDYATAAKIADTIDWYRVKNNQTIVLIADVYEASGRYAQAKANLKLAYDRSGLGRQIAFKLVKVCIKCGDIEEAEDFYDDFVSAAPRDISKYLLQYELAKAKGESLDKQISILEQYLEEDMDDRWAFELAKLYHKSGQRNKCIEQCDTVMLWFSDGRYVDKAMDLKMIYTPLTPSQQQRYEARWRQKSADNSIKIEEIKVKEVDVQNKYNTQNIQKALKESMDEIYRRENASADAEKQLFKPTVSEIAEEKEPADEKEKVLDIVETQDETSETVENADDYIFRMAANLEKNQEDVKVEEEQVQIKIRGMETVPDDEFEEENEDDDLSSTKIFQTTRSMRNMGDTKIFNPRKIAELADGIAAAEMQETPYIEEEKTILPEKEVVEEAEIEVEEEAAEEAEIETEEEAAEEAEIEAEEEAVEEAEIEAEEEAAEEAEIEAEEEAAEEAEIEAEEEAVEEAEIEAVKETEAQIEGQMTFDDFFDAHGDYQIPSVEEDVEEIEEAEEDVIEEAEETLEEAIEEVEETEELEEAIEEVVEDIVEDLEEERQEAESQDEVAATEGLDLGAINEIMDEEKEEIDPFVTVTNLHIKEEDITNPDFKEEAATEETEEEKDVEEQSAENERLQQEQQEDDEEENDEEEGRALSNQEIKDIIKDFIGKYSGVQGLDKQMLKTLQNVIVDDNCNIFIIGDAKSGKTSLGIDIIKVVNKIKRNNNRRIAKISADKLLGKDMQDYFARLEGSDLFIENICQMDDETLENMFKAIDTDADDRIIVIEDEKVNADKLLAQNEKVQSYFVNVITVKQNKIRDWVAVAEKYAEEKGYEIDEMGSLALHAKIDQLYGITLVIQKNQVEGVIDNAIKKCEKVGLIKKLFGKKKAKILTEEHFS